MWGSPRQLLPRFSRARLAMQPCSLAQLWQNWDFFIISQFSQRPRDRGAVSAMRCDHFRSAPPNSAWSWIFHFLSARLGFTGQHARPLSLTPMPLVSIRLLPSRCLPVPLPLALPLPCLPAAGSPAAGAAAPAKTRSHGAGLVEAVESCCSCVSCRAVCVGRSGDGLGGTIRQNNRPPVLVASQVGLCVMVHAFTVPRLSVRPSLLYAHIVVAVAIVAMHARRQPGLQIVGVGHHRGQAMAGQGSLGREQISRLALHACHGFMSSSHPPTGSVCMHLFAVTSFD